MKAVLILATAALAAAQGYFVGEPDCAIPCLTDAIGKVGCAAGDIKCQCSPDTQTALVPLVGPCLQSKCSAKELGQALQAGNDICSSYSAGKLTFTASPMPSSASAAMTTAPSGSGSASGTTLSEPLMSIQTSIPSNVTASMSRSMSMSITSSASVTTSTGSGGGSSTGASTSADSSASASSTSAPANAAATQGVARVVGGVLAGMVGLAVAL
ncbi:hypothetical protein PG997_009345 [Apiospora hydei]|uniref:CFEM domain-containing protein n=1 Tax=Apiospora hydei TaxID=1337664 RepID=A0ABR1VU51_9PEZI